MDRFFLKHIASRVTYLILLLSAGGLVSAFSLPTLSDMPYPCVAFCTDQTGLQHNYIADRDSCRAFADEKTANSKDAKSELATQYNKCMADKGWGAGGAPTKVAAAPAPAPAPVAAAEKLQDLAPAAGGMPKNDKLLSRSEECAYARHAAAYSSNMAARAKACDAECKKNKNASACGNK